MYTATSEREQSSIIQNPVEINVLTSTLHKSLFFWKNKWIVSGERGLSTPIILYFEWDKRLQSKLTLQAQFNNPGFFQVCWENCNRENLKVFISWHHSTQNREECQKHWAKWTQCGLTLATLRKWQRGTESWVSSKWGIRSSWVTKEGQHFGGTLCWLVLVSQLCLLAKVHEAVLK